MRACARTRKRTQAHARAHRLTPLYLTRSGSAGVVVLSTFNRLHSQVTVVNTQFVKLMQKHTPSSVVSKLAHEAFNKNKEYFTQHFPKALKVLECVCVCVCVCVCSKVFILLQP